MDDDTFGEENIVCCGYCIAMNDVWWCVARSEIVLIVPAAGHCTTAVYKTQ